MRQENRIERKKRVRREVLIDLSVAVLLIALVAFMVSALLH